MHKTRLAITALAAAALTFAPAAAATAQTDDQPALTVLTNHEVLVDAGHAVEIDGAFYIDGEAAAEDAAELTLCTGGDCARDDYDRDDQFGTWASNFEGTGCDTRNAILQRDMQEFELRSGDDCIVETGVLHDPYTDTPIDFVRGVGTSNDVQIDHIIPAHWAWQGGAYDWSQEERVAFYNDGANLWAVDGPANGSKSDHLADVWLPGNDEFACQFAAQQNYVLGSYDLAVTQDTRDALVALLSECVLPVAETEPTEPEPTEEPSEESTEETEEPAVTEQPEAPASEAEETNTVVTGEATSPWVITGLIILAIIGIAVVVLSMLKRKFGAKQ